MTNELYIDLILRIMRGGTPISRRGMLCHDMYEASTWNMGDPIITIPERELNYQFMFAEALWILRGNSRLDEIAPYCKKYGNYSDDGRHLSGAYGPMYVAQQRYVVDALIKDLFTRQAVIMFWRPNPRESSDIPCTLSMQFIVTIEMKLDVHVSMRSSDAYLGLPYDIFSFSMMAYHTLLELKKRSTFLIELGLLTITSPCQHIYERDMEKCKKFVDSLNNRKYKTIQSPAIDDPVQLEIKLAMLRDHPERLWTE